MFQGAPAMQDEFKFTLIKIWWQLFTANGGTGVGGPVDHVIVDSGTLTAVTAITNALPAGTAILGKTGIDQTTPGTTNGVVVNGNTKNATATYSPSQFSNLGANATLNIKASAGNVFSLSCHNENAADRWVQLHNTATVPTTGVTVPIYSFLVPTNAQIVVGSDFFTNDGVNFSTGIAFAFSTTKDVYTAATAADQSTWVHFK